MMHAKEANAKVQEWKQAKAKALEEAAARFVEENCGPEIEKAVNLGKYDCTMRVGLVAGCLNAVVKILGGYGYSIKVWNIDSTQSNLRISWD